MNNSSLVYSITGLIVIRFLVLIIKHIYLIELGLLIILVQHYIIG